MNTLTEYYALCLVAAGRSKDVSIEDRMHMISERLATKGDGTEILITDKGKDKIKRKGK